MRADQEIWNNVFSDKICSLQAEKRKRKQSRFPCQCEGKKIAVVLCRAIKNTFLRQK